MNRLLSSSKLFFKRNSATILTVAGAVGAVTTAVMAVKATPKALALLEEAKEEKGEDLTKLETIKVAGPVYIPSVLVGASSVACIFGANVLNKRKQASLVSAYALLDNSYKEYKKKVDELYGEEAGEHVRAEIAKDKYTDDVKPSDNNTQLFYDFYSGRYFESTMENVIKAEYEINRKVSIQGYACLNDFYLLLGLEEIPSGYDEGWSAGAMFDMNWQAWIDFAHETVIIDEDNDNSGLECCIISMTEPILEFEDYC